MMKPARVYITWNGSGQSWRTYGLCRWCQHLYTLDTAHQQHKCIDYSINDYTREMLAQYIEELGKTGYVFTPSTNP